MLCILLFCVVFSVGFMMCCYVGVVVLRHVVCLYIVVFGPTLLLCVYHVYCVCCCLCFIVSVGFRFSDVVTISSVLCHHCVCVGLLSCHCFVLCCVVFVCLFGLFGVVC